MKIKHASLSTFDVHGHRAKKVLTLPAKGGRGTDGQIQWHEREDLNYGEVRRYVTDADWAGDLGNDSDSVLTDWFQVWLPRTRWLGGTLEIDGFMRSVQGIVRDGYSPRTGRPHPSPFDAEIGDPFVMVRWTLS